MNDNKWNKVAEDLLLNRKIVKVRYMTKKESKEMIWDKRPVCFLLDNGTWVYPSMDDEGNNGGALFSTDKKNDTLPVLY